MKCPFCGGQITRAGIISEAGERHFSLCCDVSLELIDNYEAFKALPLQLQQAALKGDRKRLEAMDAKDRDLAQKCAVWYKECNERYAHLMKGDERCLS